MSLADYKALYNVSVYLCANYDAPSTSPKLLPYCYQCYIAIKREQKKANNVKRVITKTFLSQNYVRQSSIDVFPDSNTTDLYIW